MFFLKKEYMVIIRMVEIYHSFLLKKHLKCDIKIDNYNELRNSKCQILYICMFIVNIAY